MLTRATVTANIPAGDLKRARAFYADKLGVEPSFEVEGMMLIYKTGSGSTFSIYETEYAGKAEHTIAQWHVDSVEDEVRALKGRGVTFEHYDLPGVTWNDDVASIE